MRNLLYIILTICYIFLAIRFIVVKNQELVEIETNCQNWCSEMKFRGQEYVICLTGCNMKGK